MPHTYSSKSIPYTAAPPKLIISDLTLWFRLTFVLPPAGLPSIIFPIGPFNSGSLDELYPTPANLWAILIQLVLIIVQVLFLLSLVPAAFGVIPPWLTGYTPVWGAYALGFVLATRGITKLILNGGGDIEFVSNSSSTTDDEKQRFAKEKWIFVNGVAAGQHWMQSNLDRLALTFRREIIGVHNETRGILFDLVECILERTLGWATPSARKVYARLVDVISDDSYERIVLILHSQGAIEGGLALDWLFATVPAVMLERVEVYTFGSATNHFNNPSFTTTDDSGKPMPSDPTKDGRILKHIEHYANSNDYVSQFGVLNFRPRAPRQQRPFDLTAQEEAQNMYAGRLFVREAYGHQFNNNYLDNIFTLNADRTRVLDSNPFMNSEIDESLLKSSEIVAAKNPPSLSVLTNTSSTSSSTRSKSSTTEVRDENAHQRRISFHRRVKDVSRLWDYRNGGIPQDDERQDSSSNDNASTSLSPAPKSNVKIEEEKVPDLGEYPDGRQKLVNPLNELD